MAKDTKHDLLFRALTEREQAEGYRVIRQLGGNNVGIELTLDDIADGIDNTKLWLSSTVGERCRLPLTLVAGQSDYRLPSNVREVVDVILPDIQNVSSEYRSYFVEDLTGFIRNPGNLTRTTHLLQQLANRGLERQFGNDPTWQYEQRSKVLTIRPNTLSGPAFVEFVKYVVDVESLDSQELQWFRRYLLATCKRTLGQVRRKYSEVPMGGSKTSMDGSDLMSESEAELQILQEEALAASPGVLFVIG